MTYAELQPGDRFRYHDGTGPVFVLGADRTHHLDGFPYWPTRSLADRTVFAASPPD